jgi:hypothetical protein
MVPGQGSPGPEPVQGVRDNASAPGALGVCRGDSQGTGTGRLTVQQLALGRDGSRAG